MRKLAVFVEGQTELVFVREILVKWFDYDGKKIGFNCYNLLNNNLVDTSYQYGDENSENYYLIVNVGNDNSVLGKIRARMPFLVKNNYNVVIGLRDMFSDQYIKDVKGREINDVVTQMHIDAVKEQIDAIENGAKIRFHFAIMEVEACLLGMHQYLEALDNRLTQAYINENIGLDLNQDPETTIFHPAVELEKIYELVGKKYGKHDSDISTIMSKLTQDDFRNLAMSGKCQSFYSFMASLVDFLNPYSN